MTLPNNRVDLEKEKFIETGAGDTAVRTIAASSFTPDDYDEIALSYSSGKLEQVIYKLSGATVLTLTLSYLGSDLIDVIKS